MEKLIPTGWIRRGVLDDQSPLRKSGSNIRKTRIKQFLLMRSWLQLLLPTTINTIPVLEKGACPQQQPRLCGIPAVFAPLPDTNQRQNGETPTTVIRNVTIADRCNAMMTTTTTITTIPSTTRFNLPKKKERIPSTLPWMSSRKHQRRVTAPKYPPVIAGALRFLLFCVASCCF